MHLSARAKLISRTDLEAIIFVVRFLIKKSIFAVLKKYDSVRAMETNWREVNNKNGCVAIESKYRRVCGGGWRPLVERWRAIGRGRGCSLVRAHPSSHLLDSSLI